MKIMLWKHKIKKLNKEQLNYSRKLLVSCPATGCIEGDDDGCDDDNNDN